MDEDSESTYSYAIGVQVLFRIKTLKHCIIKLLDKLSSFNYLLVLTVSAV